MAQEGRKPRYSDYYHELESSTKARYQKKLVSLGEDGDDPYTFELGTNSADMPEIEHPDIRI